MYIVWGILCILLLLVIKITYNTVNFKTTVEDSQSDSYTVDLDYDSCIDKLSKAIQIKTISNTDRSKIDWKEFEKYRTFLKKEFPLVHRNMKIEIINNHSLVYRWKGINKDRDPMLVTAHMDVVPVEQGTEDDWKYDAFSGKVDGEYLWGRGALDIKIHMISALEAAEQAISRGFVPDRDIYFAFGHDEEIGGAQGATKIAEHFKNQGLRFDFLIDEGGVVIDGLIEEIEKPIALIGIGEKGYADIQISVNGDGGHSSMPPKHTALGTLGKVITNIEDNQMNLQLIPPIREFLLKIGPEMKLVNRIVLSNLWLFEPIFLRIFANTKSGNAMLRTTTAVTMSKASIGPNVLPQKASVTSNFRILPGEDCDMLMKHLKDVNKGIDIELKGLRLENPSAISPTDSSGFRLIESKIRKIYSSAIVAPYVVLAGTDARKYESVCDNIYRFTPYLIDNDELASIHSTNERISLDNIKRCLDFFSLLYME